MWVPIGDPSNRDWLQIGYNAPSTGIYAGMSYVLELRFAYPPWGDVITTPTLVHDKLLIVVPNAFRLITPGRKTWQQSYDYALSLGARLPTLLEGQAIIA